MNDRASKASMSVLWRWPAICALLLLWALLALVAWLTNRFGTGFNLAAEFVLDIIDELKGRPHG